jgi:hypothetical protein
VQVRTASWKSWSGAEMKRLGRRLGAAGVTGRAGLAEWQKQPHFSHHLLGSSRRLGVSFRVEARCSKGRE